MLELPDFSAGHNWYGLEFTYRGYPMWLTYDYDQDVDNDYIGKYVEPPRFRDFDSPKGNSGLLKTDGRMWFEPEYSFKECYEENRKRRGHAAAVNAVCEHRAWLERWLSSDQNVGLIYTLKHPESTWRDDVCVNDFEDLPEVIDDMLDSFDTFLREYEHV